MKRHVFTVLTAVLLALWMGASLSVAAPGAVYTMTNDPNGNEVVIFSRGANGLLIKTGSISTNGIGSGGALDPLGSQGSLVLSQDRKWLLAVNAGSNELSVFRVQPGGLAFVNKADSGGVFPVSLTISHNLVYVLNAESPNITGFNLSRKGELTLLDGSTRSLGSGTFAQVGFDPLGETLVATDKANNEILVYAVDENGLPGTNPVTSISNGATPFGFVFDQQGHLLVAEAGSNSVSSYHILSDDTLQAISPSVPNEQQATCWIVKNRQGFLFTANPGSQTISAYKLNRTRGNLVLLAGADGIGNKPIDLAITMNGQFLYALDPGNGTVDMFQINNDGSLTNLGALAGGFSIFAQGIAAR